MFKVLKIGTFLRAFVALAISFNASLSFAEMPSQVPEWFTKDVARGARWLPQDIRQLGLQEAVLKRWNALPEDIKVILWNAKIPGWMIALIPWDVSKHEEINKQLRFMVNLAGAPSMSKIGARAEQLLIFGGAAQLPTPGDNATGRSLGPEGCTAAMSKYVIAELQLEFPQELASMPAQLGRSQSSVEMKSLFYSAVRSGARWLNVQEIPFSSLQNWHVEPGSLMIAQKPGGTHVFGWTRVPSIWGWSANNKIAIGNTGLPQFGDRMILAQEFLTDYPNDPAQFAYNPHGPINSTQVIVDRQGRPVLSDPRTNVYASRGSSFVVISFR